MDSLFLQAVTLRQAPPRGSYLNDLPVVQQLARQPLTLTAPVTLLVGENGVGKSTLIEAIALGMGFNAEGGTRNFAFSTADTHSALHEYIGLIRGVHRPRDGFFLRAESFYNVASYVDEIDRYAPTSLIRAYGGRSLHEQSHGESFLSLVRSRFGGEGFYILDEPEAALSPTSLTELLAHMRRLELNGAQLIIATHSPILMTYPGAAVLELSADGIRAVDYRTTAHYQLTRRFLESPESVYRTLFAVSNDENT